MLATDARAGQSNANATWSYLRALYRYDRTVQANFGASRRAVEAFLGRVAVQCPGALAGAPKGKELDELKAEILVAPGLVWLVPDRHALNAAARAVEHLHWSDRRLTKLVGLFSRSTRALEHLRKPDVCSDARAWAATGYSKLPAATIAFERGILLAGSSDFLFGQERQNRLAHYEGRQAKRLARRIGRLERVVLRQELSVGTSAGSKLLKDLGLPEERVAPGQH